LTLIIKIDVQLMIIHECVVHYFWVVQVNMMTDFVDDINTGFGVTCLLLFLYGLNASLGIRPVMITANELYGDLHLMNTIHEGHACNSKWCKKVRCAIFSGKPFSGVMFRR